MNASRGFLLALVAALGVLAALLVFPFLQFVLLAALLVYVLYPLHRRLAPRVGDGPSAAALVTLTLVLILVPAALVLRSVLDQARMLYEAVREGDLTVAFAEDVLADAVGVRVDLASAVGAVPTEVGSAVLENALSVFDLVTHVVVGLGVTLFLLYYFLKDGAAFVAWLREVTPLPPRVVDDLFAATDSIMWAVLAGHVFVAAVQGGMAGVGLFLTGIPNALFWTVVMMVLALLPVVGAFLVWGPAALYLFANGETVPAAALAVYGTVVVGITDDYLRPVVVDRRADVNPSVILLGIVGGLYVFGTMGIFFGPVVLALLKAAVDVFAAEYGRL
ncbi:AI-2E family transporter [Halostella litorea]|uniref:AI-2E family transporter n=1 Tax=Halostella litorea TaxID=2528831 RepID=UPI001092ABE9|nr:AI-2E family transporter [Halostella litorea]